jgi:hypothetical protein
MEVSILGPPQDMNSDTWKIIQLARRRGPVQTASSRQDLQGSSVTSEETRTDSITSINKIVHQLISRIICVVVVIEPTPIHSIANIQQPTHNL